jgi:hypothetical protein
VHPGGGTGFAHRRAGYQRAMDKLDTDKLGTEKLGTDTECNIEQDDIEPVLRFDDEVDAAAQLVPQYGYDEAERIIDEAVRTHRPVETFVPAA